MGIIDPTNEVVRPTRIRYRILIAACSVAVLTYIHRVGFAQALPKIQTELKFSDWQSAWLTGVFLLAYGGFEIPAGLLGDRLGVRHLLTLLVLGWSVVTGCVAWAVNLPNIWILPFIYLLVMRFVFGMFQAGGFPSLARMMADWMPMQERASAQGAIWMSTRAGGMIIPGFFFWLVMVFGDWKTPLWLLAGLGVLWCAAFWPWFRNRPEDNPHVNEAERALIVAGRAPRSTGHGNVPWAKIIRNRSVWALSLAYGFGGFAANFYVTLLPSFLARHRELPELTTSVLSSLPFACGMFACIGGGLVSDWFIRRTGNRKWGRRLPGAVGTALGGIGWLCIDQAHEPWILGFVLCFIFICNDVGMGPAWASCADIGERYAGTLGGAMNMIGNLFGFTGNIVAGYFMEIKSLDKLFIVYACSFWMATLCWQFVDVTKPVEES